jgi:hypothetical protein
MTCKSLDSSSCPDGIATIPAGPVRAAPDAPFDESNSPYNKAPPAKHSGKKATPFLNTERV